MDGTAVVVRVIDDFPGIVTSSVSTGTGKGDGIGFCGICWNVAMPDAGNCAGGTIVSLKVFTVPVLFWTSTGNARTIRVAGSL